ncbi:MAG TPA: ATP synthase subunit I [Pyrinomonadaceae bacterium]|jgi:hypothetical protein|nr:ATP synthase subunit I [Pyrinomonadaceae bacterium]
MEENAEPIEGKISEKRLLWITTVVLAALIGGSVFFASWRVTTGLLMGGALSFLNLYWLKKSLDSLFGKVASGSKSGFNASFYIFRYAVIAFVVFLAASLDVASVAAMLLGLLSFAFAILIEAIIQLYLTFVNREEN